MSEERVNFGCLTLVFWLMGSILLILSIVAFKENTSVPIPSEFGSTRDASDEMSAQAALAIGLFLLTLAVAGSWQLLRRRKD